MTDLYLWRVYAIGPPGRYETVVSATEPTVAPSDGSPIDPAETIILEALFLNLSTPGYVNLESQLADNQALKINASDANGGIDINSGLGGITIDTTNSVSIDAQAASNFTTTNGNLTLSAIAGLTNIDAGSGVNIGNDAMTSIVLIATGNGAKNVGLGSSDTTSTTAINSGTGGLIIGANANGGEITIGDVNNDKTIRVGNSSTFSRVFQRFGVGGGLIRSQGNAVFVLGDADTTILTSHLIAGILSGTPDAPRSLNLPSAADVVSGISGSQVDDAIDFSVINKGVDTYTLNLGTAGTMDGNNVVIPGTSGLFRLRITSVGLGTEAYTLYRLS